ncbi:hypothetical protein MKX01_023576, partial [Papaver californicum]
MTTRSKIAVKTTGEDYISGSGFSERKTKIKLKLNKNPVQPKKTASKNSPAKVAEEKKTKEEDKKATKK